MQTRPEGIKDVATIELSTGKKVERRSEHSHPCGDGDWRQAKLRQRNGRLKMKHFPDEMKDERKPKLQARITGGRCRRARHKQRNDQDRECDDESCNRPSNANVEERGTGADRRSNANKRAHCSNQRRSGQEEGQRSVDMIPLRTDEVPHLVSKQDAQQGSAK